MLAWDIHPKYPFAANGALYPQKRSLACLLPIGIGALGNDGK